MLNRGVSCALQVQEVIKGSSPISGTFTLAYPGHAFQETTTTGPISVHASAGALASALNSLSTMGDIHVSRSGPSAEGEMMWTVTFLSREGDVPAFQVANSDLTGSGAAVRASTSANGVAPLRGTVSLVAYGVPREVRQWGCNGTVLPRKRAIICANR